MAEQTVSGIVVKLMFESNGGEVFAKLSGGALASAADIDRLLAANKGLTVSFEETNAAVTEVVGAIQEQRIATEGLRAGLQEISKAETEAATTFNYLTEAGKNFSVTIKKADFDMRGLSGALREPQPIGPAPLNSVQALGGAAQVAADELKLIGPAGTSSMKQVKREMVVAEGAMQELIGRIADLKYQMLTAPAEEVPKMGAQLKLLNTELAQMQGRGIKDLRRNFFDTRFELQRTHQAMFALMFLVNSFSGDPSNKEFQKIKSVLSESTQAALGVAFGLSAMGGSLAKVAGPVGTAVGLIAALVAILNDTNEAAAKAAEEGLKMFTDALIGLPKEKRVNVLTNIDKTIADLEKARDAISYLVEIPGEPGQIATTVRVYNKGFADQGKLIEENLSTLSKFKDTYKEQIKAANDLLAIEKLVDEVTQAEATRLGEIRRTREQLLKYQKDGMIFIPGVLNALGQQVRIQDELEALKLEEDQLTRSTLATVKEEVKVAGERYQNAKLTGEAIADARQAYIGALNAALQVMTTEEDRGAILAKITELQGEAVARVKDQYASGKLTRDEYIKQLQAILANTKGEEARATLEKEIHSAIVDQNKAFAEQMEARQRLAIIAAKLETQLTDEKYGNQRAAEAARHAEVMANIASEAEKAGLLLVGPTLTGEPLLMGGAQSIAALDRERMLNAQNIRNIEIGRLDEIHRLTVDNIVDELERTRQRYDDEIALRQRAVEQGKLDESIATEEITALRRQRDLELADIRERRLRELVSLTTMLGNVLGESASQFVKELADGVDVAIEIVRILNSISQAGGFFSFISSILGIAGIAAAVATGGASAIAGAGAGAGGASVPTLGLLPPPLKEGGYTGDVAPNRPAGIVHGGEMVFEEPIVRNNRAALEALRTHMQARRPLMLEVSRSISTPMVSAMHGYQGGGSVVPFSGYSGSVLAEGIARQIVIATEGGRGASNEVVAELRRINQRLGAIEPARLDGLRVKADIDNGTLFFRREADKHDRFMAQKDVG